MYGLLKQTGSDGGITVTNTDRRTMYYDTLPVGCDERKTRREKCGRSNTTKTWKSHLGFSSTTAGSNVKRMQLAMNWEISGRNGLRHAQTRLTR